MKETLKILLYGYGNPGRQDDGLGIAFVDRIKEWVNAEGLTGFDFDSNYQLNIEDAATIAEKDIVIFADASVEDMDDFCLSAVDGTKNVTFTTHAASPGYIVQLCEELFDRHPPVYLLHIKGYEWEFMEGLTGQAQKNLDAAIEYFQDLLKHPEILLQTNLTGLKICD